jgi:hypothetical protein
MTPPLKTLTKATLATLVALSAESAGAVAENCHALPKWPQRYACMMREHPEHMEAKRERYQAPATERGFTFGTGGKHNGTKDFIKACMQGKQS